MMTSIIERILKRFGYIKLTMSADDTDGWIRSRLPTEADADADGDVYIKCKAVYHDRLAWGWRGCGAACINYKQIVHFQPWKPMSGKS